MTVIEKAQARKGVFYGWWVAGAMVILFSACSTANVLPTILYPFLAAELGLTASNLGLVTSVWTTLLMVWPLAVGPLLDKLGSRKVLLAGSVLTAAGTALFSTARGLTQMVLYHGVLLSLAGAMTMAIPTFLLLRKWFNKKAGIVTGAVMAFQGLAGAVLYPVLGRIAAASGWRPTVAWTGLIASALSFGVTLLVVRESPEEMGLNPDGVSTEELQRMQAAMGQKVATMSHMTLPQALRTPQFWLSGLVGGATIAVLIALTMQATPLAMSVGLAGAAATAAMSSYYLTSVVGKLAVGYLGDKIGKRLTIQISCALMALVSAWAWLNLKSPSSLQVVLALGGLFTVATSVLGTPFLGDLFGVMHLGKISGIYSLLSGALSGLGPVLAGRMAESTGSYSLFFLVSAVIYLLAVIGVFFVRPTSVELHNAGANTKLKTS